MGSAYDYYRLLLRMTHMRVKLWPRALATCGAEGIGGVPLLQKARGDWQGRWQARLAPATKHPDNKL
jgi:hypothetical protein